MFNHYYSFYQGVKDTLAFTIGSFSIVDLIVKFVTDDLNFHNANTFVQFLFTIVGLLFAIQRYCNYRTDSKINSERLRLENKIKHEEWVKAERDNFPHKWNDQFLKDKS